jgi:hypothetical protein
MASAGLSARQALFLRRGFYISRLFISWKKRRRKNGKVNEKMNLFPFRALE